MSVPDPIDMSDTLFESRLRSLELLHRGKVRDIYIVDDERLLIVASDRLSAFDVVLPDPIPEKGRILTTLSRFWFDFMGGVIRNHLIERPLEEILPDPAEHAQAEGRAMLVRRLRALPIEAIVRGYIIGTGWKDYQKTGGICGIALPEGLQLADRLPEPMFTPSTKAAVGEHDQNIDLGHVARLMGADLAEHVRETSLAIYRRAAEHALSRGIIIADTKFEFGVDNDGELYLIDEVLTPDSSRFWPVDEYRPGTSPPSFDKQYVRDYLEGIGWNKQPPAPTLPDDIIARTAEKYREARDRLIN